MNTNELKVERSPETIAVEINTIKDETRKAVVLSSIEIGKRLVEAKEVVPHGEWGNWLEQYVEYSQSTANNLMKIYEELGTDQAALFGGTADSEAIAKLSYTQALEVIKIPSYERDEFMEKNNVHELSTRELKKVIEEKAKLEKKLEIYENEAKEHEGLTKQIGTYETSIGILEKKLEAAESENNEDTIGKLEAEIQRNKDDLDESKKKVKKLEAELKAKPIDVKEVIEKVPDEVEEELENLRKRLENSTSGEAEVKFKFQFESIVESFKLLIASLDDITDEETSEKYKGAVKGLLNKMEQSL